MGNLQILLVFAMFYQTSIGVELKHLEDFPLADCQSADVDLLLLPDVSVPTISEFDEQLDLLSQLVQLFTQPDPDSRQKLRVGMTSAVVDDQTRSPTMTIVFDFDRYTNVTEIREAIENYEPTLQHKSFINSSVSFVNSFLTTTQPTLSDNQNDLGSPRQVLRVAVMIINVYDFDYWYLDRELASARNISTLFLIIIVDVDKTEPSHFRSLNVRNYVVVSSSTFSRDPVVKLTLCGTCGHGWFTFSPAPDSQLQSSCYKLVYNGSSIYPTQANEICQTLGAQLVCIESQDEMNFLNENIPEQCKQMFEYLEEEYCGESLLVIIGIQRTKHDLARRFRWVNGLPLTVTNWLEEYPKGGYPIGCGLWYFTPQNVSSPMLNKSGWIDIGCGQKLDGLFLCEAPEKPLLSNVELGLVQPASNDSVSLAVERGELFYCFDSPSTIPYFVSTLPAIASSATKCFLFLNQQFNMDTRTSFQPIMFPCRDELHSRIPYFYVCNRIEECSNGYDERNCGYRKCNSKKEFTCWSGQCVPLDAKCDLFHDCLDASDELDCNTCRAGLCGDGRCLPSNWLRDDESDCVTVSNDKILNDMLISRSPNSSSCALMCNRTECVASSLIGDGKVNCLGPEGPIDELFGSLESTSCGVSDSPEWSPRCVYVKDRFHAVLGCRNLRHLLNCQTFVCPEGYVKCPNTYCIPNHFVMNGVPDCPQGEDEAVSSTQSWPSICPRNFVCNNSPQKLCLHPSLVCDGHAHCPNQEDEIACHVTCRDGFICQQGAVYVNSYDRTEILEDLSFIDPRTRYLDLSGVNISTTFPIVPAGRLTNLLFLRVSHCSIHTLSVPFPMDDLATVVSLDLSYNDFPNIRFAPEIEEFPLTYKMSNLSFLNLSHNTKLTYIEDNVFGQSSFIKTLDLSYTGLTYISSGLLSSLDKLLYLNLSHTLITNFAPDLFPVPFKLIELDLRGLAIDDVHPGMFNGLTIQSHLYTDNYKLCCPQLRGDLIPEHACVSPLDPFSSCDDLMAETLLKHLMWVIGVIATLCNATVILFRLTLGRDILHFSYGQFVTHLGASDMLMGVYLLIIAGADVHYRDRFVWDDTEWRTSAICKAAGLLSTLSSEVSTFFIILITIDRFLVIKYPFREVRFSKPAVIICSASAWVVGITLSVVPLLPPLSEYHIYTSNSVCLGLPFHNQKLPGWQFSTVLFVFFNFIAFILIAVGQYLIYKAMSKTNEEIASWDHNLNRKQEYVVARRLALVAITNLFCWFPIGVMGMLALSGYLIPMKAYSWSAVLVLPINAALNPLIYTHSYAKMRLIHMKNRLMGIKSQYLNKSA